MAPGLALQRLTTREPDHSQLAVAIAALRAVLDVEERDELQRRGPRRPRGRRVIEALVAQIEQRFAELSEQMSDPAVIADRRRNAEVGRAYRQLEPAAALAAAWRHAQDDAAGAEELLAEGADDEQLRELLASSRAARSPSSRRRSAWRWSRATPTTTRT